MNVLYTDNDPKCCQWLENLVAAGQLPSGRIVCRDIRDFKPADFDGYRQVHHFCGIGGWPYALKLAGWPEDEEVWTGSCPCQPLSCNGYHRGHADERHVWPSFFNLLADCKAPTVFGEQVASQAGREWLSAIRCDLEGIGYAVGASNLRAECVSRPHTRKRLFWVANANSNGRLGGRLCKPISLQVEGEIDNSRTRFDCLDGAIWLTDPRGKKRPIPGSVKSMVDGVSFGMVKARGFGSLLKGYGNAIVPQVAAQFIQASIEAIAQL